MNDKNEIYKTIISEIRLDENDWVENIIELEAKYGAETVKEAVEWYKEKYSK